MGMIRSAQSMPRRSVQNRNHAYNSCRKLFRMLKIYISIDRYSDSNVRAKFVPKIALMLRGRSICNSRSKKKSIFKSCWGGTAF